MASVAGGTYGDDHQGREGFVTHTGVSQSPAVYDAVVRRAAGAIAEAREDPKASLRRVAPQAATAVAFVLLFGRTLALLARDWWVLPEAGHGLLLAPMALWLAWKSGIRPNASPNVPVGVAMLVAAVLFRYVGGLAAELFTMRASMVLALGGLTVFHFGFRQLLHWWLPFLIACLAIPLPELIIQAIALPLQFQASQMGSGLLESRGIPVLLTGNVIRIPGHELFVTEACSGLRSLTALLSLAVLMGGMMLKHPATRVLLVALAIPIAIAINGVRVFLTGFLVFFVSPEMGTGFMHMTEGWLLFLVSFGAVAALASLAVAGERMIARRRAAHA